MSKLIEQTICARRLQGGGVCDILKICLNYLHPQEIKRLFTLPSQAERTPFISDLTISTRV